MSSKNENDKQKESNKTDNEKKILQQQRDLVS